MRVFYQLHDCDFPLNLKHNILLAMKKRQIVMYQFLLNTNCVFISTDRRGLEDEASASRSGGQRFEPNWERMSKDGCLSWDLFQYGRLVSRER
ncbi:hypothetical protein DPMN_009855 [Dreissena polymorpha]|uniref:Uncharacterized protein n=1 Tax=Dreissena polymorpha TaxID=45954 RepID=A0A9D4S0Z5_DREPO|nr:hypothetical protein DPMN_009855 [Dreissena polymorpha]